MSAGALREWAASLSASDVEAMFDASLKAGDTKGVEAALTLLATKDPHRAQQLLDAMRLALAIAENVNRP